MFGITKCWPDKRNFLDYLLVFSHLVSTLKIISVMTFLPLHSDTASSWIGLLSVATHLAHRIVHTSQIYPDVDCSGWEATPMTLSYALSLVSPFLLQPYGSHFLEASCNLLWDMHIPLFSQRLSGKFNTGLWVGPQAQTPTHLPYVLCLGTDLRIFCWVLISAPIVQWYICAILSVLFIHTLIRKLSPVIKPA